VPPGAACLGFKVTGPYTEPMTRTSYNGEEVQLAAQLIQSFSPSGRERPAAEALLAAFRDLSFDDAYLDGAGNAVGVLRCGDGPTVMLNGHIDTVPLGDEDKWPHPPLSGGVAEGRLWGRGACDMKGALACMTYAARDVADEVQGTVLVTGVVQEEVGGLGARFLGETARADVVILGEPSKLRLMLGHRGRVEVEVDLPGRIAHAAKSELGDNALYRAARLLRELEGLELPSGGPLGASSLTPTHLSSYPPDGKNVVPGRATLTIDYRNIPSDEPEAVLARLRGLEPGATFSIPTEHAASESGEVAYEFPRIVPAHLTPGENAHVGTARRVLKGVLEAEGLALVESCWWFGTDAPHLAKTGGVVIGFGPGEEELAHTTQESVPVEHLRVAREGYAALLRAYLGGAV